MQLSCILILLIIIALMKQTIIKLIFLITLFTNSYSHPHTFIEVEPTVEINKNNIEKLHIKWTLDEMTSMMLIMELDVNADGKFDKNENNYIYENYFSSLKEQNFYTRIIIEQQELYIKPFNFKASIENDRLIYAFEILNILDIKDLKIDFHDEDLFVGMMLEKEFIKINGIKKENIKQLKKQIFGVN